MREAAQDGMLGCDRNVHKRFHVAHSWSSTVRRFCPECLVNTTSEHGEPYWRREHQLPLVVVCPEHGCVLRASRVDAASIRGSLMTASPDTCPSTAAPVTRTASSGKLAILHQLARRSVALLNRSTENGHASSDGDPYYRARLAERGLTLSKARVSLNALEEEVLRHIAPLREVWPTLFTESSGCGVWLRRLVGAQGNIHDPAYHLLLGFVLEEAKGSDAPFGPGPWPCLNPLAEHDAPNPIVNVTLTRTKVYTFGRFECSCGFTYSRSRRADGSITKPRVRAYGETLRPLLAQALAEGWGLHRTAAAAKVDNETMRTAASDLGFGTPWPVRHRPELLRSKRSGVH